LRLDNTLLEHTILRGIAVKQTYACVQKRFTQHTAAAKVSDGSITTSTASMEFLQQRGAKAAYARRGTNKDSISASLSNRLRHRGEAKIQQIDQNSALR